MLAVFAETDVSRRGLSQVLEALDGRPYAEHYYLMVHELPHRKLPKDKVESVRRRLLDAGFQQWLVED